VALPPTDATPAAADQQALLRIKRIQAANTQILTPLLAQKRAPASRKERFLPPPARPVLHRHCAAASKTAATALMAAPQKRIKSVIQRKGISKIRVPGDGGNASSRQR
jgi:hypothetical protein